MPTFIVDADGQGSRLDRFLRRKNFHFPQALFEKWSRQKKLFLNGEKAKASSRLHVGDTIIFPDDAVPLPPPEIVTPMILSNDEAKKILLPMIIFENRDMMVINKPSGLATQGGTGQRLCVDDLMGYAYPTTKIRLTHRIDKDTSGLLMLAKTLKMASDLTNAFRNRTIKKAYLAVCEGTFHEKTGTIDSPVGRSFGDRESMEIEGYAAKEAITVYEVVDEKHNKTLVRLYPETGRTHQLRVHMQELGHPIVGDKKYDGLPARRLMLHAHTITFEGMTFEAPVPKEFIL